MTRNGSTPKIRIRCTGNWAPIHRVGLRISAGLCTSIAQEDGECKDMRDYVARVVCVCSYNAKFNAKD